MPRYGSGHEDFDKEAAELAKLRAAREAQVSREAKYQAELQKTTGIEDANTRTSVTRKRAKAETADVEERAAKSTGKATEATRLDTAAIEANTKARVQANRTAAFGESALRGGRAPQFAEAYRLQQERGAPIGTNEIRRLGEQYGQSGYRRAVDVRQALAAGLAPPAEGAQYGASTRMQAAHEEVVAADVAYARSRDAYTKAVKKGDAAEAELAYGAREAAKSRRESAASGLAAAEKAEADLVTANAAKIEREIAARQRIIEQHTAEARIERLALPAPGQTAQGMPLYPAQTRTQVGGYPDNGANVPRPPVPPPGYQPDWTPGDANVGAAQAAEAAAASASQAAAAHHANALSIAQEAEAQGRLADAAHIYNTELDNPARAAALESAARAQFYNQNAAAAERRMATALRDTNVAFYPLDQSMHRHGALTSEFIAAAARGEVTLREMGNQAVITAGKFGGWTVAATAVYGVVGALGQVAKGAMDSASGVDQAYRVITSGKNSDALQGSFADLSRQFNVPIETAADAVYRMGQVFHNQADAVKAAEASLYSFKTGEVDVATSTQNLIAIQRAFGFSSNQLVDIYDQINKAQNDFGIAIGDTESGLAKAGGTWRNAGGDLNYLLGLFIAISKATGRSGEEIGTGLSRLYFVQHPENATKLRDLGVDVDPTQAQKTFQSAFEVAQQHPDRIQGIASGLLGNQYARLLTATLRDQSTLNKALEDTSPENAKGSAQKELAQVLGQVDEQIQAMLNGLQRIGDALAQAGTFNLFGLMLRGANDLLTVVEKILVVFNAIPSPIRQAIVMMGELYAGVALLRRVGATERFANTPLGPLADPVGRARTHTIAGLRTFQTEASSNAERIGGIATDASFRADADRRHANALHAEARTLEHLDVEDEARLAAQHEAHAAEQAARRSESNLAAANEHLTVAREQAAVAERELSLATATNRRNFNTVAAERGWVMPRVLDQPNTQGVVPSVVGGAGGGVAGSVAAGEAGAAAAAAGTARTARAVSYINLKTAEVAAGIGAMSGSGRRLGLTGVAASRAADKAGSGLAAGARGLSSIGTGVRGMGGALSAFAAALGPLDVAIIAFVGLSYAWGKFKDVEKNSEAARNAIQERTSTVADLTAQQDEIHKVLRQQSAAAPTNMADPYSPASGAKGFHGMFKGLASIPLEAKAMLNDWTGATEAAEKAQQEIGRRALAQYNAEQGGRPIPQQTYDQLIKRIKDDQQRRAAGLISQAEYDRLAKNHVIELNTLLDANQSQHDEAMQALADANRAAHGSGYYKSLIDMSSTDFSKEQQGQTAAVSMFGLTPHNLDYMKQQYRAAENRWRTSNTPDALIALNQAREAYFSAVTAEVQKELQFQIAGATSETQRRGAYSKALADYRRAEIGTKQQSRRRLNDLRKLDKEEQRQLQHVQLTEDQGGEAHQRYIDSDPTVRPPSTRDVGAREARQRKAWRDLLRKQKIRRDQLNTDIERQNRDLTQAELELKQQAYDDRQQGRDILLNLQVAGTQDQLQQAALRIAEAKRQVEDATLSYGTHSRQYRTALTALRQAQTQQAQAVLAAVQADNALLEAQAGDDPVKQAQQAAKDAQTVLDTMQADPKQYDPNAVKQQKADVINAQRAARQATDQQTRDLSRLRGELATAQAGGDPVPAARAAITAARLELSQARTPVERLQALVNLANANNALQDAIAQREIARFNLLKSQTDDPVAQAKIDLQAAAAALAGARGYDKMQKQADYNNAKRAYQDAQISDKEDTINFNLQMDKITADQAADQLEELAKIKGISKAKKRELLLQAKQLRDQASGDYQLDIGNIRLPSLYEIRRFVQGGQPNASQIVTDNRSFNVTITTAEGADAFAKNLETTNGTAAKSTARSMLMR